jgi:hypothetical protein
MADDLKGFSKEALKSASNVGDAIKEIKDQTRELDKELKGLKGPLTAWESSFTDISNLSKKILDTQGKSLVSSKGTADAIKSQKKSNEAALALDIKINELLKNKTKNNIALNALIDKQVHNLSEAKDQARTLAGVYGDLAKSSASLDRNTKFFTLMSDVVKDIPGLRMLSSPFEAASKASREQVLKNAEDPANKKSVFGAGAKAGVGDAISGMKDFFTSGGWIGALIKVIQFFIDAMFAASKQIADFQRNLAVSKDTAVEIRDRFFEISDSAKFLANTQKGNLILQKDLVEAQESFNNALGLAVDLSTKQNEEFAAQFTNVKKFYNLNEQEQKGLINLNVINGKTVNETKNSILGQTALYKINTKEAINVKKVLKDVLTTSNSIKLSIRGGGEALTQAVINTQRLGISLNDVDKISDSLLNFEQSISSELEAELLTGRDLNLEKARAAALSNDQVTLTEEINRLVKDAGPDFEKNKIAMQASAAAIGIGVDQLADMVTQQKAVEKFKQNFNALDNQAIKNSKKLTDKEKQRLLDGTASTAEYYKFAKEQGKDVNEMLGEEMATRLEAQDAQQKFNDALEKAKETFSRFVDGGYLDKLADIITGFVEWWTGPSEKDKEKSIVSGNYGMDTKNAYEATKRGEITPMGPGPKFAAGGIVTKRIDNATLGEAGPEAVIPLGQLMGEFKEMKQLLAGILNKEGTIVLNGTKMGTAMAVGSYRTQ